MLTAAEIAETLTIQLLEFKLGMPFVHQANPDGGLFLGNRCNDLLARQHRGGESNSWVISMEIGEDVIEQGADHVACKCHVDTTRYFIWLIVNERVQAGYGVKQGDTFGVKTLPGRRHFEDSRAPFDQAAVEMPLDPPERIAD